MCICAKCKDRRGEKRIVVTKSTSGSSRNRSRAATAHDPSAPPAMPRPPSFERPQTRRRSGVLPARRFSTVWDVDDEDEDDAGGDSDDGTGSWTSRRRNVQHLFLDRSRGSGRSRRRHSSAVVSGHEMTSADTTVQPSRRSNRARRTTWHRLDQDEWASWSVQAPSSTTGQRPGSHDYADHLAQRAWMVPSESESELDVTEVSDDAEDDDDVADDKSFFGEEDQVETVWSSTTGSWGAPGTALQVFDLPLISPEPQLDFGSQLDGELAAQLSAVAASSNPSAPAGKKPKRNVVWREGPERRKRRLASMESRSSNSPPALDTG